MTTPRIGDTVHWVDANRTCFAAITIETNGDTIGLHVISAHGHQYKRNRSHDPGPTVNNAAGQLCIAPPEGFTPGTWHHIH